MTASKQWLLLAPLGLTLGAIAVANPAAAQKEVKAKLTLVPTGGMQKAGYYSPQRLSLSASKPTIVKKEPTYKNTPMYGAIPFGQGDRKVTVALDEAPDGTAAALYVDANNDGDLTNDGAVEWKRNASKAKDRQGNEFDNVIFQGKTAVAAKDGANKADYLGLAIYRFGNARAKIGGLPTDLLLYYRDYARTGKLTLGGKEYPVLLMDEVAAGQFGKVEHGEKEQPRVRLLVDRNSDGKFDSRFEGFDLAKPFNIDGKVYEIGMVSPDGANLTLKPSKAEVAEIPLPADLGVGKPALAFTRTTLEGKTVNFPGDFKGKLVMLDFWATWCGPCIGELPGLTKNYEKFHGKGFEILGISLDQPNQADKVKAFLKEKNMPWQQVYDGKFWQAEIGQLYSVDSIPRAFLIDGNTGKIIATTNELRGEALEKTLEKALETLGKAAASE